MRLSIIQFIAFSCALGWFLGEAFQQPYETKIFLSLLAGFIPAYLNNLHGIMWKKIKGVL